MINVETYRGKAITDHRVEIVERKGRGHPDTICDAIMESIAIALSSEYLRAFGTNLHHNIDKGLLVAGRVAKHFGGGEVLSPMELIIGDRATYRVGDREIPVDEIAIAAARQWLRRNLRHVDPDRHLRYRVVLAPGSDELTDIFARSGTPITANDTSAAVGYYPLSPTEQAVLDLEGFLNGELKVRYPDTGEDVKVMALRQGRELDLTVAMPLLATAIGSEGEYFARKQLIHGEMQAFLADRAPFARVGVRFNTLDLPGRRLGGVYLSLLGTSAEDADSGQVGRGNRVNGLIALNRPMGTEAAAGKNAVSHVGKIYNVLAHRIAREIYLSVEGIREVYVLLLSRIGAPVKEPQMAAAQLLLEKGRRIGETRRAVAEVFERELAAMDDFCLALSRGDYPVW
ncbi:MAG TPA: methionine adenosyltransferase [Geobacteraceae bacterium]